MSTIDKEALRWVVRASEGPLRGAEQAEFDAWYAADRRHRGAYLRAQCIQCALEEIEPAGAALAADAHESGESVESVESVESADPLEPAVPALVPAQPWYRSRRGLLQLGGMAAAVVAVAGMATWFTAPAPLVIATAKGEVRSVPLADQSLVSVNSASRIAVTLTERSRKVELQGGEAWFSVAKDRTRPFVVEAGTASVRAIGTAFSVRRLGDGAEVLVTEGVVEVWTGADEAHKQSLKAGDMALVSAQPALTVSRDAAEVTRRLAWKERKLVFVDHPLSEAVADFNRYSTVPIVLADPSLGARRLVGTYSIDSPHLFAQAVSAFMNLPLTITPTQIVIGARPPAKGGQRAAQ